MSCARDMELRLMNGMFGIENGGALIRAAPLGLLGFGGTRTQGSATFATLTSLHPGLA